MLCYAMAKCYLAQCFNDIRQGEQACFVHPPGNRTKKEEEGMSLQ